MHKQYFHFSSTESTEQVWNEKIESLLKTASLSPSQETKSIVSSLSLQSSIGFNPRAIIFSLTLKLISDRHTQPLVKYSFGMLRGLYKEYLRSKTPSRPKPPRRSYRSPSQISSENTEINEFGEVLTQNQIKKGIFHSQSRPESPCFIRKSWESSKSSIKVDLTHKQSLRSLLKIPNKFIAKHFLRFKENLLDKNLKKTILKTFVNKVSSLCFRAGFNQLLRVNWAKAVAQETSAKGKLVELNSSQGKSESFFGRSISFENKDKELWRKRHPIRNVSPGPGGSRGSLLLNLNSEPDSPGHILTDETRRKVRRNTEKVLKRFESFGNPTKTEGKVNTHEPPEDENNKKPAKIMKKQEKPQKLRNARPDNKEKTSQQVQKLVKNLEKNRKSVLARGFLRINSAVDDEKALKKRNAAGLIGDLLSFRLRNSQKRLEKEAFDQIKSVAKQKPATLSLKRDLKKPPKKPILRSGNQKPEKPPVLQEKAKNLIKSLEFTKNRAFKNKLLAFLAITQNSAPNLRNVNNLNKGLRTVFRVLEAKKFSNICRVFHCIKRYGSQRVQVLQKKYIVFSQKLRKIMDYSVKARTLPAFSALLLGSSRSKAARKLKTVLESVFNRVKFSVKPMVWYRLTTVYKEKQLKSRIRPVKMQFILRKYYIRRLASAFVRWENFWQRCRLNLFKRPGSSHGSYASQFGATVVEKFSFKGESGINSGYSTRTGFASPSARILPQPKNIHDYIDDFFEVGRSNTETSYLPRTSSVGKFRNIKRTK